ncbi:tautomerase family protein [Sphingomonas sp. CD22]|jgi:4-oxalocrotonate tautomerase|uniref:tautomerase family protein n=1 Tax=Sphingomonas sp. CD22 TaxID=3100214 RepID=UPI002ADF0FD5|nr:tautomerase family protein [Sphingomonas sp. CD22]MEA1086077.1 tautomerase family protein [Sphingomonas sp. CD22]
MPHVIVKLWPGKSDDQKQRLTEAITRGVTDVLEYDADAVSVAFEEVAPAEWTPCVYEPDILAKWPSLTKQPGYGMRPGD